MPAIHMYYTYDKWSINIKEPKKLEEYLSWASCMSFRASLDLRSRPLTISASTVYFVSLPFPSLIMPKITYSHEINVISTWDKLKGMKDYEQQAGRLLCQRYVKQQKCFQNQGNKSLSGASYLNELSVSTSTDSWSLSHRLVPSSITMSKKTTTPQQRTT